MLHMFECFLRDRAPYWSWKAYVKLCRRTPRGRWLSSYLHERGYHPTKDGRWVNDKYEVLPSPVWNPRAVHVYTLAGKWAGFTLIDYIDTLDEGIGLDGKVVE